MNEKVLKRMYVGEKKSARQIADVLKCSENRIHYWLKKYAIPKRSIADAIYVKLNPKGDPFLQKSVKSKEDAFLRGLGLGLYWGEGTKSNKHSVRLGNTDPGIIRAFIRFLENRYGIQKRRLRFGLQLFSDMESGHALNFWCRNLKISQNKFYKVIVTPTRGVGSYRHKTKYGVLTIYFHSKKLRDILCEEIEGLGQIY